MTATDTSGRPSDRYVVAIDVGGTTIKSAIVNASGDELVSHREPTAREEGPDAVVRRALDVAELAVRTGCEHFGHGPAAVGVACLGQVDDVAGVALRSSNVGWRDVPLRRLVADRTGCAVVIGHDLRAGALAEARLGAGRGYTSFLFVAIGTGIAAATVHNATPLSGSRWLAGEIGHVVVEPGGCPCVCGARGCLEAEASGPAIARRYRDEGGRPGTARDVAQRAAAGEPVAVRVWQTAARRLGRGLVGAVALLDPGLVVLGGGLALAGDQLVGPVAAALAEDYRFEPPPVVTAQLGDRAACLGAGLMAWDLAGTAR